MGITQTPPKDLAINLAGRRLADLPVPSGREEEWRFTPMQRLRGLHALAPEDVVPSPAGEVRAASGVVITSSDAAFSNVPPADRIAVAALELVAGATVVTVPEDLVVAEPVVLTTIPADRSAGRARIQVGAGSRVTVVVDVTGSGSFAGVLEVDAGEGSDVVIVHIADGDRDQVLAAQHHLRVGANANVRHIAVTLGGDLVRLVTSVEYAAPGGSVEALGVFFTDDGQHHEHRLFVDHSQPHCASDVLYKGALQGEGAHAVWIGDVLIRSTAVGTKTYEMNRNLVLTDGARADSVPNLEIETGDVVSAGHASATGRFDDEQMFYLLSRGIPEVEAKRLVVRGFINDVVQRIPVAALRERLLQRVERRLGEHDPRYDFEQEEA